MRWGRQDWQERLRNFLIAGGTQGKKLSEIRYWLNGYADSEMINNELEVLLAEHKVQKFHYGKAQRAVTIFRATTLLCESHTNEKADRNQAQAEE